MLFLLSYDGRAMRLTEERWRHISTEHREMATERDRVIETLRRPDRVQLGERGERLASRAYPEPPFNGHHLVVVYLEEGLRGDSS